MKNFNVAAGAALFIVASGIGFGLGQQRTSTSIKHALIVGEATVRQVAFSPDGKVLAVACGDLEEIRLYSSSHGKLLHTLKGHSTRINCLRYTPNGRFLLSGGQDKRCVIWDTATNKAAGSLENSHTGGIVDISIDPGGKQVVTCGYDGMVVSWNLEKKTPTATVRVQTDYVGRLAHSHDGKLLIGAAPSAGKSGTIRVWNAQNMEETANRKEGLKGLSAVALTPDGKEIVACGGSGGRGFVKLWDSKSLELAVEIRCDPEARSLAISPDGKMLAVGFSGGEVGFYNISPKARSREPNSGLLLTSAHFWVHDLVVHTLAFRSDGKSLASCCLVGTVKIWVNLPDFD